MEQINALLDELEVHLSEGKKVPLTNQYIVNYEAVINAIRGLRESLPDAVKEANQVLENRAQLEEEATLQYNNAIAESESKARAMVLESKQRADSLYADAKSKADALYADAQRQADALVDNAERKAKELVATSVIKTEAEREAAHILSEARAEAQRDRRTTIDHCQELLQQVEEAAIGVANELRDARLSFERGR